MTEPTKIDFHHRRVRRMDDLTDVVEMLFPGNRNQQHAAARILIALKGASTPVPSLKPLEDQYDISRRILQRTRAKLSRLGLIERVTWMNRRYAGQEGWLLSGRFGTALRHLADRIDHWRHDEGPRKIEKENLLVGLLSNMRPERSVRTGEPAKGF